MKARIPVKKSPIDVVNAVMSPAAKVGIGKKLGNKNASELTAKLDCRNQNRKQKTAERIGEYKDKKIKKESDTDHPVQSGKIT